MRQPPVKMQSSLHRFPIVSDQAVSVLMRVCMDPRRLTLKA